MLCTHKTASSASLVLEICHQFTNPFLNQFLSIFGGNCITRASLWSNVTTNKYIPAPSFGLTGMPRKQFDDLWMWIRFSEQPPNHPSDMTSEQYRWRLVDDFIKNFNKHRAQNFLPSDEICVDESMSRWYGQGGH